VELHTTEPAIKGAFTTRLHDPAGWITNDTGCGGVVGLSPDNLGAILSERRSTHART